MHDRSLVSMASTSESPSPQQDGTSFSNKSKIFLWPIVLLFEMPPFIENKWLEKWTMMLLSWERGVDALMLSLAGTLVGTLV